jgi:hypothetical protein
MTTTIGRTVLMNADFDVQHRLQQLRDNVTKFRQKDELLMARIMQLDPNKFVDLERGAEIGTLRKVTELQLVDPPIELDSAAVDMMNSRDVNVMIDHLKREYARFSQEDRLLWLNNLHFLITPDIRKLNKKLADVRNKFSVGGLRNMLLGGPSRMGKTHFLRWCAFNHPPVVEEHRNRIPVVMINAPVTNQGARPLLKRLIQQCGANYTRHEQEETLLNKVLLLLQQCGVELILVDEIEHVTRYELKRRFIELSNLTTGIPMICSSVYPEMFVAGDAELRGRWKEPFTLTPFQGKRLESLLFFIELLLPFPSASFLSERTLSLDGSTTIGPAAFIEAKTAGILDDIVLLLRLASQTGIYNRQVCLEMPLLDVTWNRIQMKRNS